MAHQSFLLKVSGSCEARRRCRWMNSEVGMLRQLLGIGWVEGEEVARITFADCYLPIAAEELELIGVVLPNYSHWGGFFSDMRIPEIFSGPFYASERIFWRRCPDD